MNDASPAAFASTLPPPPALSPLEVDAVLDVALAADVRIVAVREAFFARVDRTSDGCWLWSGKVSDRGYGRLYVCGERLYAHRVSYELHHGPIAKGLFVCHRCDTPRCVNPAHLFLGTAAVNNADMWKKGRGVGGSVRGERVTGAKLTAPKVRSIRQRLAGGAALDVLAAEYGVTKEAIWQIAKRKTWKHVKDAAPQAQSDKKCGCGRVHDAEGWARLPICGVQSDGAERFELRHCECGSTIAVALCIVEGCSARPTWKVEPSLSDYCERHANEWLRAQRGCPPHDFRDGDVCSKCDALRGRR